MIRPRIITILSVIALAASVTLSAAPAYKGEIKLRQPDGTVFSGFLTGDESAHIMRDAGGRALMMDSDGFWRYAFYNPDGTRRSSGYAVGEDTPAHVLNASTFVPQSALALLSRKNRKSPVFNDGTHQQKAPATRAGDGKPIRKTCIIILAQYKDVKMKYCADDFRKLINEGEKCARKYFEDQCLGEYEFHFEIGPIVTLSQPLAYYGGNKEDGGDKRVPDAIAEACRRSSEMGVDFSKFDDDNDGWVDNVFMFGAGKDEAQGGGDDCIWSHAWNIKYANIDLTLNGKKIGSYAVSAELRNDPGLPMTGIGTFCHEYAHIIGLPDMYDTDGEDNGQSECLWGSPSLMDSGCYNDSGNTPPCFTAVERDLLGIGKEENLKAGSYTLEPIGKNGRFIKYETGVPGEYYLFECRGGGGWDSHVGASGLAIYHVDKSDRPTGNSSYLNRTTTAAERWYYNEVNCNSAHQCADMIEADETAVSVRQVFFPYGKYDSFSHVSNPGFVFWDGTPANLALGNITKSGDNVTFDVYVAGSNPPEPTDAESEIFQDAAIIRWKTKDPNCSDEATVEWGVSGKEQSRLTVEAYKEGHYATVIEGLQPRTAYTLRIWYVRNGVTGKDISANFTTKSLYENVLPFITFNDVARNPDKTFAKGALIPLRIYNFSDEYEAEWYMNGQRVNPDKSGYYELTTSGTLKAIVKYKGGDTEIITKEIIIK